MASPHPAGSSSISKERNGATVEDDDYIYDDEDEPSKENGDNEINYMRPNSKLQLLTKNHTLEADVGQMVVLPCHLQNVEENTIVMWHNTSNLLFMKNNTYTNDPRLTFAQNYSLLIKNVQISDDSIYKCTVLPIQASAFITLKVKSQPHSVRITHGNADYTNRDLEIQQRDRKFIIHCRALGYPTPSVTWSFRGKHLDDNYAKHTGINIRKEFLEIHDVKAHHAGDYECLAQNGIGEPVSAVVNVQIKSSPSVVKHVDYLNTAIGENAELMCLYHSNPEARKVQWFRGEEQLRNSAKFAIVEDRHNHHQRTRLTVRNIEQRDLEAYFCKVENALGESTAKTILGLLPGSAHLIHSNYSDGLLHTVWRVRSAQPLSDLQILYKGENTKYTVIDATISEQNKEESGDVWNIKRSIRLPEGEWFITARAKNTEGWSYSETVPIHFQIPSEVSLETQSLSGSGSSRLHSLSLGFCLLLFSLVCRLL
ncbi:igLON family member 5 isoform X2 [Toxorhynchites rutilus septentrionalis]|uniref:igLON family member 5 isoform X2 n=1 Tax=Toxorhynchites rutilus septentrionalis TaxID=329112 RepID=UPI002479FC91|nr:igLON family member 5 isoform X2 [Toxorhynchites rutilus septentrionalis]